ncbi:MAG: hypothetical protein ISS63_16655 [Desulfobacteraceae bacterium]|nr:hypothetical protein [Desulfobacteraceae bacterium]
MAFSYYYEETPECPARKGGDEWHTFNSPPLVGLSASGGLARLRREGQGEGVKFGIFTPTLILPHQGGGDIFSTSYDAMPGRAGRFTFSGIKLTA